MITLGGIVRLAPRADNSADLVCRMSKLKTEPHPSITALCLHDIFTGKLYLLRISIISPKIHARLNLSQTAIDLSSDSFFEQHSSVSNKWILNNIVLLVVVPLTLIKVLNNW